MKSKKIFILLPDGVGLRNFAFTSFIEIGRKKGWDIIFWNNTPFDLVKLGYKEVKLEGKPRAFTDLLKRAKISTELDHFAQKFNDAVYHTYRFSSAKKNIKSRIKETIVSQLTNMHKGEKGLQTLRKKLKNSERKSAFYQSCKEVLIKEKPDFIFCTNQRPLNAIAALTAAQDLGIPTGTFIFSWDNLPKATLVVDPEYYFVWSEYMKAELLKYYPFINPEKIYITGSPQFEPHLDLNLRKSREEFFIENQLDLNREYICFSGDDQTTSPDDPQYLNDAAETVKRLNTGRKIKLGIIFRRSPVDFSERYAPVLEKYKDLIVPVAPIWEQVGGNWNTIIPTIEDLQLQINTILHTKAVINLGSSMVFDFALFNKPCLFLSYNVEHKMSENWSVEKVYNFIHFKSIPTRQVVFWLNSKEEIGGKILKALEKPDLQVQSARTWFELINQHPVENASQRIWNGIDDITNSDTK